MAITSRGFRNERRGFDKQPARFQQAFPDDFHGTIPMEIDCMYIGKRLTCVHAFHRNGFITRKIRASIKMSYCIASYDPQQGIQIRRIDFDVSTTTAFSNDGRNWKSGEHSAL